MMYSKQVEIAADCLANGAKGDPGLLNYELSDMIDATARMVANAGGELKSRQVIASIIMCFSESNPNIKLYGD